VVSLTADCGRVPQLDVVELVERRHHLVIPEKSKGFSE
jgi:hypothetical protein